MKKTIKSLMMGAMMMALPFLFTSCEDILGHWEKPTPATPTVEEMLTNLSSALEEGALVTITYTVDGVTYTSTFKKVGDEYVEQSTTSASRALTRAGGTVQAQLHAYGTILNALVFESAKVVLNVEINSNDCTTNTTFSKDAEIKYLSVNGKKAPLPDANDQTINIHKGDEHLGSVGCKAGETWKDLYDKQSKNGHMVIQTDDAGGVFYSNGGETGQLYNDAGFSDPVTSDGTINQNVFFKLSPESYQEASWNNSTKKVDYTWVIPDNYTLVSSSEDAVDWNGGTYVVKSNVFIGDDLEHNDNLTLNNDVNLILCDGATLIVNGGINANGNSLTIYSQSQGDGAGNLCVVSNVDGLTNFSDLTIHGGNIRVESEKDGINEASVTVYGGKLSVTSGGSAINTYGNDMNVYGGEVNAISSKEAGINLGTLTVYGGKVTAEGFPAIEGKFKAGTENVHFYERNNTTSEWETIDITSTPPRDTSNKRYFCADIQ